VRQEKIDAQMNEENRHCHSLLEKDRDLELSFPALFTKKSTSTESNRISRKEESCCMTSEIADGKIDHELASVQTVNCYRLALLQSPMRDATAGCTSEDARFEQDGISLPFDHGYIC